jgi:hypothetical protein
MVKDYQLHTVSAEFFGKLKIVAPRFFTHSCTPGVDLLCLMQSLDLGIPYIHSSEQFPDICQGVRQAYNTYVDVDPEMPRALVVPISPDKAVQMYHRFTYLSLITDLFSIKNNVAVLDGGEYFEIKLDSDSVLSKYAYQEFGEVCEELPKEIAAFTQEQQ